MKNKASLVIVGAGIVGCGVAYFLSKRGWKDIVVLEQGPLFETGGSTTHAPGLVFQINPSRIMSEFAKDTVALYSSLELDGEPCWTPVGSLEIAWTPERLNDLHRKTGIGKTWGIEAEIISATSARKRLPFLSESTYGAMWTPSDGIAKAPKACESMSKTSIKKGVDFRSHTRVTGIDVRHGRVKAVQTSQGTIETNMVLASGGIWGPLLGKMAGVPIPLSPMEHLLAWTDPLPELKGETSEATHPILRHQDEAMYYRQRGQGYAIGSYQHEPLLNQSEDILSHDEAPRMPSIMAWTPEHFEKALKVTRDILPTLSSATITDKYNGMFSFTPDAFPIMGESPIVKGFWSAQAVWITHAGGVAKTMAEWIDTGYPSMDMREADIARFHPHEVSDSYVRTRSAQQYREVYDIKHPLQQIQEPREIRLTPFNTIQKSLQAVFFESSGWERPQWYESNSNLALPQMPNRSKWQAQEWSPIIGAEHKATRENVALYDISPFTKLEISGQGALNYLQFLTTNQLDRPVGKTVYTAMLNERAGIRCDLTITRIANDRFLILTGGATGPLDTHWLNQNLPTDGSVEIKDISSSQCCIGIWGPEARNMLQKLASIDLSNKSFPYMTAQRFNILQIPVLGIRISYVGELGWEIYTSTEYGSKLWESLWEVGQNYGIVAAGSGAFESLRVEKGYRLWGTDIHTEYNPLEAGLNFSVKMNKGDFIGKSSLEKIIAKGVTQSLSCLVFDNPNHLVMGKEPILQSGERVGYITSANFGYTTGKSIAYGYLPTKLNNPGQPLEVEYFGQLYQATVCQEPLYDPKMDKLKN
ncbi:MAG: FAD-dependent oxidoreductase [Chloroflexota bacterium]|nr:FAD-dependent oxidoreductase [Chloroflexota bacterium]